MLPKATVHVSPRKLELTLDGVTFSRAVSAITLAGKVGHIPTILVTIPVADVTGLDDITPVHLLVETQSYDLLVAMGWTPPAS